MKKEVCMIGRTGRTILTKVYYKNIVKTIVEWPDRRSEVTIKRI